LKQEGRPRDRIDERDAREVYMLHINDGQCGLCLHFGEHHQSAVKVLTQIQKKHEAPEDLVEDCGHPKNAALHLKVTPISGCDGFEARPN
jgi:hypothetical protein